jgi:NADH:ubiquinone oxidoreductase subunit E
MNEKQRDRAEHIFKFMEYDQLTDSQHDLVLKFETQFESKGWLSDRQIEIMEDIFKQAAEAA